MNGCLHPRAHPRRSRGFAHGGSCRRAAWLATALWLGVSCAWGADFPKFEFHQIDKIGNMMGQTSLVDVDNDGDLDGDGDNDIVRSTGWYENADGRGGKWIERVIHEGSRCHEGVAADVDGDGDVDICSKPWNGDLHVYLRNRLVEDRRR